MSLQSINSLANLSGMTYRTIKKRLALHLHPVQEGRSLLYESVEALPILYQVENAQSQYELEAERARLAHHQANNEALKERQLTGELLPAELVIDLGSSLVGAARAKILSLHSKIRSRYPTLDQSIADEIEELSREALRELGSDGLPTELRRRIAPAIRRMDAPAQADDKPVG